MKEKEPVVEKMVTIMMMPEGRKVPNILVRRVVEHHSKIKKKNLKKSQYLDIDVATLVRREYKMDILNITGSAVRALLFWKAVICVCLLRLNVITK